LALAKLTGSTGAVLVPFIFAYLLSALVLALSPGLGLQGENWMRMAVLMGVFALYLIVFAAFGLLVSALTHRRMTAFLGLLGLWAIWLFVAPNLAVRAARSLSPVMGVYDLERRASEARWEVREGREEEIRHYWERNPVEDWNALPETRQRELLSGDRKIQDKWDAELYARLSPLQAEQRNQVRRQQRLAMLLSAASPLGPVRYASMDLARTGFVQHERIEDALNVHLRYLSQYVREKASQPSQSRVTTDFSPFTYQDRETVGECLSRNAFHILNLALLAVLGFAGAYVAILRYDVR
jgi:ABC-type transport system involved in multi-copper enzyme maturation permease subunit